MALDPHPRPRRFGWLAGASLVASGLALLAARGRTRGRAAVRTRHGVERNDPTGAVGRGRPEAPPSAAALQDGYERHDAKPRILILVMVVAVTVIASSIGGLFVLLHMLHARDAAGQPLTAQQRAVIQPPGPPLQSSPQDDLASLGRLQTDRLGHYAWVDEKRSRARIPIARAMTLVTGKSLDPTP